MTIMNKTLQGLLSVYVCRCIIQISRPFRAIRLVIGRLDPDGLMPLQLKLGMRLTFPGTQPPGTLSTDPKSMSFYFDCPLLP